MATMPLLHFASHPSLVTSQEDLVHNPNDPPSTCLTVETTELSSNLRLQIIPISS